MDPILLKAHNNLDREVDKAFDVARKLTNERQRQELRGVGEGLCLLAFIKIETTSRVVPRAGDFDRSRCWV